MGPTQNLILLHDRTPAAFVIASSSEHESDADRAALPTALLLNSDVNLRLFFIG